MDSSDPRDRRIEELERENAALRREVEQLRPLVKVVEELTRRIERLEKERRRGKRQAAPFGREKHSTSPKKPGRPAGHPGARRSVPERWDEEVRAPLGGCPDCGGKVSDVVDIEQFVVDLPPEIQPHVLRIVTQRGWCTDCEHSVRSSHPMQSSQATGAAKVSLGPRAVALAQDLKHRKGVPYRDIAELFGRVFGLRVTHSALVHGSVRLSQRALPTYEAMIDGLQQSRVVHTDDTGWRIGTQSAWLWVFATSELTVYVVDYSRGSDVVTSMLGEDFGGVLVSDGLPALDSLKGFIRAQCLGHPLRRARELEAEQDKGAVRVPRALKGILRDAIALAHRHDELTPGTMDVYRRRIERRLDTLLCGRIVNAENKRLVEHLRRHRDQLFVCLRDPDVPPTNNLSEQQLRGAVKVRKIGGCNRSEPHAFAHAVTASVAQTAHRNGLRFDDFVAACMRPRADVRLTLPHQLDFMRTALSLTPMTAATLH